LSNRSELLIYYEKSFSEALEDSNFERQAYSLWGIGEILRITGNLETAEQKHMIKGLNYAN